MSHITTFTGKHIDPTNPDINLVFVEDIAHALSLTCRGNGHVKTFYSVAQHCIYCAEEAMGRGYEKRLCLALLLHDASEAYMSDVPRPFKQYLPEYIQKEEELLEKIYGKFLGSPLTDSEQKKLKEIDDDLLYFDMVELLGQTYDSPEPILHINLCYDFVPFEQVEKRYLELYHELTE